MVFTPQNLDQHVSLKQRQSKEKGLHTECRRVLRVLTVWSNGIRKISWDQTMEISYDNMKKLDLSHWQQSVVDRCEAGK